VFQILNAPEKFRKEVDLISSRDQEKQRQVVEKVSENREQKLTRKIERLKKANEELKKQLEEAKDSIAGYQSMFGKKLLEEGRRM
jgi:predicted RNase H-like nuclease (RuvC/YqgF family)